MISWLDDGLARQFGIGIACWSAFGDFLVRYCSLRSMYGIAPHRGAKHLFASSSGAKQNANVRVFTEAVCKRSLRCRAAAAQWLGGFWRLVDFDRIAGLRRCDIASSHSAHICGSQARSRVVGTGGVKRHVGFPRFGDQ